MPFQITILDDRPGAAFADEVLKELNPTLNGSSPVIAAQAIDSLCSTSYEQTGDAGPWLRKFWLVINETARQLPYTSKEQDRMAAVLKALQDLPPRTLVLGGEWSAASPAQLWSKLTGFDWHFWDGARDYDPAGLADTGTTAQLWSRLMNLECFTAKLCGLCGMDATYNLMFILSLALEGTMKNASIGGDQVVDKDPACGSHFEYNGKIAALSMVYAGHQLYRRDEDVQNCPIGPLWEIRVKEERKQGRKVRLNGICKQRWEMWRARFGVVFRSESIDLATRQCAKRAQDAMKAIERREGEWKE